jgi:hypothetical protein
METHKLVKLTYTLLTCTSIKVMGTRFRTHFHSSASIQTKSISSSRNVNITIISTTIYSRNLAPAQKRQACSISYATDKAQLASRTSKRTSAQISFLCGHVWTDIKVENIHGQTYRRTCIRDIDDASNMSLHRRTRQEEVDLVIVVSYLRQHSSSRPYTTLRKSTHRIFANTRSLSDTSGDTPPSRPDSAACHSHQR